MDDSRVFLARELTSFAGEKAARGKELFRPVKKLDNALVITKRGIIEDIIPARTSILSNQAVDLGDSCVAPALVNAHVHSQLSWLAGKTLWHNGFSAWLKSMVPHILGLLAKPEPEREIAPAIESAWRAMAASGTALAGDIGGSIPGALTQAFASAGKNGLGGPFFCEWFGFAEAGACPWPERCSAEIGPDISPYATPCGHALYSTSPEILRKARNWCRANGKIFTFHLAESDEETAMLLHGEGSIYEYYKDKVLPPRWRAPGLAPFRAAEKYGLLGPGVLAVHGVKLNVAEIAALAESGTALCLCPRSNRNLGVGDAPVRELVASGALLCLGTDGLTSNTDLDVKNEALYLRQKYDLPWPALWRMATINGAGALGMKPECLALRKGARARFSLWPDSRI